MTILKKNETILFIGDSITDCGRRDVQHKPLGCGYVQMCADMLSVREPEKQINVINTGIGGNTIEDLRSRWIDDALSHKPDWMSIKIGINDCHRWVNDGTELHGPEKFAEMFDELLSLTVSKFPNIKLLLIDPFYAGLDVENKLPGAYRGKIAVELAKYLDIIQKTSEKFNTKHVKIHDLYQEHFKKVHPKIFFPNEPVHPNSGGHLFIAEATYKELIP